MSGYTPLFSTMLEGTLHGRWPHTGVWACLLSMVDYRGEIDKHPRLIASAIGIPISDLLACLKDFISPDPDSRSPENEGRRLELIDPDRDWGWRVVNIQKYRSRASSANQVDDGRNAKKVKKYRDKNKTPADTARHQPTLDSDSDSDSDLNTNKKQEARKRAFDPGLIPGLNLEAWRQWIEYRAARKPAIKEISLQAAAEELAEFGEDQATVVRKAIAAGYQGLFAPKNGVQKPASSQRLRTADEIEAEENARAQH